MRAPDMPIDPGLGVISYLPARLRPLFLRLPRSLLERLCEIRLRVERPLMVVGRGDEQLFIGRDGPSIDPRDAVPFTRVDEAEFLQLISRSSVYALEEELRHGFVTLPGGHRVGLCGEVVLEDGRPRTITHFGSFNVRIARAVPGAADAVVPNMVGRDGRVRNTIIISPPGGGKTTLLRDIARRLSWGGFRSDDSPGRRSERDGRVARAGPRPGDGWPGLKVAVIDERSEIAACFQGVPQLDVGPRTDVIDRCPKAVGVMQMLRSMSPQVIITDEIGRAEDVTALLEAIHSGVSVVVSAHGNSWKEVAARPALQPIVRPCAFQLVVVLGRRGRPGAIEVVFEPDRSVDGGSSGAVAPVHID